MTVKNYSQELWVHTVVIMPNCQRSTLVNGLTAQFYPLPCCSMQQRQCSMHWDGVGMGSTRRLTRGKWEYFFYLLLDRRTYCGNCCHQDPPLPLPNQPFPPPSPPQNLSFPRMTYPCHCNWCWFHGTEVPPLCSSETWPGSSEMFASSLGLLKTADQEMYCCKRPIDLGCKFRTLVLYLEDDLFQSRFLFWKILSFLGFNQFSLWQ